MQSSPEVVDSLGSSSGEATRELERSEEGQLFGELGDRELELGQAGTELSRVQSEATITSSETLQS